jgi:hypothetical protein
MKMMTFQVMDLRRGYQNYTPYGVIRNAQNHLAYSNITNRIIFARRAFIAIEKRMPLIYYSPSGESDQ